MYDFYKYYVEIGFERYSRKVEISRQKYDEFINLGKSVSGWNSMLIIETVNGNIEIDREKTIFIEFSKEMS